MSSSYRLQEMRVRKLFKYVRSASAALNMLRGSLKFAPIDELNDPSELTPVMDYAAVRSSLDLLRRDGLSEDQFRWLHCQEATLDLLAPNAKALSAPKTLEQANRMLSMTAYENLPYMERRLLSTIEILRSNVGILSLSERYDSLPMWAHYADLAKGFVVVIEELGRYFSGDKTGSLNTLKRVNYADRFLGMTFDPSTQDRLFFSKLADWSYEREWRVVTALSDCRRPQNGTLYLRDIDPIHVTGIICGWRARKDEVSAIRNYLTQEASSVALISAVFNQGNISLRVLT